MLQRLLSSVLLDLQLVQERLPGRGADHAVACLLAALILAFAVCFFTLGRPPAPAISSPTPSFALSSSALYAFDGKRVSSKWFWLLSSMRQAGWRGRLHSGVRSYEEQRRLHEKFLAGLGAPAFDPDGPSRHLLRNARLPFQHAVDISASTQFMRLARRAGIYLSRPYADEPWHLEAGSDFGPANPVALTPPRVVGSY